MKTQFPWPGLGNQLGTGETGTKKRKANSRPSQIFRNDQSQVGDGAPAFGANPTNRSQSRREQPLADPVCGAWGKVLFAFLLARLTAAFVVAIVGGSGRRDAQIRGEFKARHSVMVGRT
jgi:hypothetical protein